MTTEEALVLLTDIVKDEIRHQDYERVCDLADTYYKMVSGDSITDLLRQITRRETDEEFEQRKLITNSIIPPTLASTRLPFQKAVRKKPLVRKLDWESYDDSKVSKLEAFIGNYWGDTSLEKFLEYAYVNYNYLDPNAFLITEFAQFDYLTETAKPYPFIATAEQCIMFEIRNNLLDYLVVKIPIKYDVDGKETDGESYTIYLAEDTIRFTEIYRKNAISDIEHIEINKKFYQVEYYKPDNHKVPARRFGYIRDPKTHGRTFVSCFHDIIPYLNKTLKIDSELDLSTALTAFPQRFAYVPPCPNCNKGKMPDGEICPVCNGTGKEPFHNSTMDVITLDLPRDKADMFALEQMLVYKSPPIELLEFQETYIDKLRSLVYLMMFNKELVTRNELANTATEIHVTQDNVNDTLQPFAQSLSTMWEFVVEDIATFTDLGEGIILEHIYPTDFKFKTQTELMQELESAKRAGAASSTISAIEDDINEVLYADRPDELKTMRIKNSFNPFRGMSEEDVRLLLSQGLTTRYNAVLWSNIESIFNELEQEHTNPWLYDLAYNVILELVQGKVFRYMEIIEAETSYTEPLSFSEEKTEETPEEPEE